MRKKTQTLFEMKTALITILVLFAMHTTVSGTQEDSPSGYTYLTGVVFGDLQKDVYLVKGEISVPEGEVLTIEAGSLIAFAPGASLTVEGQFLCRGKPRSTISLSSPANIGSMPDLSGEERWRGIRVKSSGKIDLRYCVISGGTNGVIIDSENASAVLNMVSFRNISNSALIYNAEEVKVAEGDFTSLFITPSDGLIRVADSRDEIPDSTLQALTSDFDSGENRNLRTTRLTLSITGATGALTGIAGLAAGHYFYNRYKNTDSSPSSLAQYERRAKAGRALGFAGGILAGAAFCGLGITFLF
ncbi:hypothetical protein CHISP_0547 [Chitinispirillum alkaliphilum]|nr:hypothetical protein CHISP_0547 [Chitinispirillum alkaliphilum]